MCFESFIAAVFPFLSFFTETLYALLASSPSTADSERCDTLYPAGSIDVNKSDVPVSHHF